MIFEGVQRIFWSDWEDRFPENVWSTQNPFQIPGPQDNWGIQVPALQSNCIHFFWKMRHPQSLVQLDARCLDGTHFMLIALSAKQGDYKILTVGNRKICHESTSWEGITGLALSGDGLARTYLYKWHLKIFTKKTGSSNSYKHSHNERNMCAMARKTEG